MARLVVFTSAAPSGRMRISPSPAFRWPGSRTLLGAELRRGRRKRQGQGRRRPATRGERDELIGAVREAALEVFLEGLAARDDVPGAIVELCREQVLEPAAIDRVIRREAG